MLRDFVVFVNLILAERVSLSASSGEVIVRYISGNSIEDQTTVL